MRWSALLPPSRAPRFLEALSLSSGRVIQPRSFSLLAVLAICALTSSDAQTNDTFAPFILTDDYAVAIRPDGRVILGGWFGEVNFTGRNNIGQVNINGSLDQSFNPGADDSVSALVLQPDGKVVVAGFFTNLAGQARGHLGRLNTDGSLDSAFSQGADLPVYCLASQADGKILAGGPFTNLGGLTRRGLGRYNSDGTLDMDFNPPAPGWVASIAVQPDGGIVAGSFYGLNRFNSDGTLDASFNPSFQYVSVYALALQPDGKILVGGDFITSAPQPQTNLARLNYDGSVDQSFNSSVIGGSSRTYVNCLALQADGKLLVGGNFTRLGGTNRNYLGRVNSDGTADPSFNAGKDTEVLCLALQADGKVMVGINGFTTMSFHSAISQLVSTTPATQNLAVAASSITWMRGGSSPEVCRTTFEVSSNGTEWAYLGDGVRIPGGWELDGVSVPQGSIVRARGLTTGGYQNGSSWWVQSLSRPLIVTDDGNLGFRTNRFGFNILGAPGQKVVVEASTNLTNWSAISTNTFGAGTVYATDPRSTNFAARFYRARWK